AVLAGAAAGGDPGPCSLGGRRPRLDEPVEAWGGPLGVTFPRQSFGRPSTRSPMMFRWISLVPPAIVYWRALTTRLYQRGASGTSALGSFTRTRGPRSSPAKSAMRTPSSDPNSFRIEPSGPGGSPRSWRVRLRSRVYLSAADSIAS